MSRRQTATVEERERQLELKQKTLSSKLRSEQEEVSNTLDSSVVVKHVRV